MIAVTGFCSGGFLRAPAGWTLKKVHLQLQFPLLPAGAVLGQPWGSRCLSSTAASASLLPWQLILTRLLWVSRSRAVLGCAELPLSCLILCNAMDCSPPGSSVHEMLQVRILEWVAISSSRGSSPPRDQTCMSSLLHWQVVLYYHRHLEKLQYFGNLM